MRISDWSSDVCSSDLLGLLGLLAEEAGLGDLAPETVDAFEYWELRRDRKKGVDGAVKAIRGQKPNPPTAAAVVERAQEVLADLMAHYLRGQEPFVPGEAGKRYADFDQLKIGRAHVNSSH